MNSINKAIRFVWHGVFYALTWKAGMRFALRCRKVVETIDLNESPETLMDRFRFKLHLTLCQMCANYDETSRELKKTAQKLVKEHLNSIEIEQLNLKLLQKYSRKKL